MSLDVFWSEQRIGFDPTKPAAFYGYHVVFGDGSSGSVHPFESARRREAYEAEVARVVGVDEPDRDALAALFALSEWGDSVADREGAMRVLEERTDSIGALWEALEEFDVGEGGRVAGDDRSERKAEVAEKVKEPTLRERDASAAEEGLRLSPLETRLLRQLVHDADFLACGDLALAQASQPRLREFVKGILSRADELSRDGAPIESKTPLGCLPTREERADLVERMLDATYYGGLTRPFQVEAVLADMRAYCEAQGVDFEDANTRGLRSHQGLVLCEEGSARAPSLARSPIRSGETRER